MSDAAPQARQPAPRRRPAPARTANGRRLGVLALVVVVVAGLGLIDHRERQVPPAPVPLRPVALVAPAGASSSSWYCTGASGTAGGTAPGHLFLTNTTGRAVTGEISVVNDQGRGGRAPVTVPPYTEVPSDLSDIVNGTWLAARVDLDGGGVVATEVVAGPTGWSETPCAATTASQWSFATGSTATGFSLLVSLYNPTATPSEVDLTFVTTDGLSQPAPFQDIVVAPGQVATADVASFVLGRPSVATEVTTVSGQIVAGELQTLQGADTGQSLRLGATSPERRWVVPRSVDYSGGATVFNILNPTGDAEKVTVAVRLPSGPVAPFVDTVAPDTEWSLDATAQIRIPPADAYSTVISATGGPGVVVNRAVAAPSAQPAPQWGASVAPAQTVLSGGDGTWVLPAPGTKTDQPVVGAFVTTLSLANPGPVTRHVEVSVLSAAGPRPIAGLGHLAVLADGSVLLTLAQLKGVDGRPLEVRADGPVAVEEDLSASGGPGVVSLVGIPLSR